jgi:membrane protein implicated in regulation of membrane protease activity
MPLVGLLLASQLAFVGPQVGLSSMDRLLPIVRIRVLVLVLSVPLALVGAHAGQLEGAILAMAAASLVATSVGWRFWSRAESELRDREKRR